MCYTCDGEEAEYDGEVPEDDDGLVAGLQRVVEHNPDDTQQGHNQVQLVPTRMEVAIRAETGVLSLFLCPGLGIMKYCTGETELLSIYPDVSRPPS